MASIYENFLVTLSATSASDSSKGCYALPPVENIDHSLVIGPFMLHGTDLSTHGNILVRERLRHTRLRDTMTRTTTDLSLIFPLEGRAWCFQERMLFPRTVNFTAGEISWECREFSGCECTPQPYSNQQWTKVRDLKLLHYSYRYKGKDPESRVRWHTCVSAYSARCLTMPG